MRFLAKGFFCILLVGFVEKAGSLRLSGTLAHGRLLQRRRVSACKEWACGSLPSEGVREDEDQPSSALMSGLQRLKGTPSLYRQLRV